eukprot:878640-Pelagomonas_calceolata.AAC.3
MVLKPGAISSICVMLSCVLCKRSQMCAVTPAPDPDHGIVQRKLSNGMLLNYRVTDHEPKSAIMRLIAPGGRASEKMGVGPDGFGAVVLGAWPCVCAHVRLCACARVYVCLRACVG